MYLGVDGGGTKTAFAIIDANGEVLAEHEESGSYYLDIGLDGLAELLHAGVRTTMDRAGLTIDDIRYAFFGLPTYGEDSAVTSELDSLPARFLTAGNYRVDNDMVCAWAGSLACQDGINLVAGTGSIGFGRYRGRSSRCGGWGEVFGDEGSAYWIACRGLQLFSKMSDGRAVRGPLYDLVRRRIQPGPGPRPEHTGAVEMGFGTEPDSRCCPTDVRGGSRGRRTGDCVISDAADELVEIVDSIRRNLGYPADEEVRVSYSGGIFKGGDLILSAFEDSLRTTGAKYRLCKPVFPPTIGAALYAAVLDNFDPLKKKLAGLAV